MWSGMLVNIASVVDPDIQKVGGVPLLGGGTASTFLALFLMKNKVKTTMRTGEQLQLGERRPDSASFRVSALYFLLEV